MLLFSNKIVRISPEHDAKIQKLFVNWHSLRKKCAKKKQAAFILSLPVSVSLSEERIITMSLNSPDHQFFAYLVNTIQNAFHLIKVCFSISICIL